jgi:hypothetical protein
MAILAMPEHGREKVEKINNLTQRRQGAKARKGIGVF